MAKRLIWSKTAKISREKILDYWIQRNKSKVYSKKLNMLYTKAVVQISDFPYSGILIENEIYRGKLIQDYYLLYTIKSDVIEILLIWDTRQNPEKLKLILGI